MIGQTVSHYKVLDDLWLHWSAVEYAPLRSDPRFQDLLLRMNLMP